jgi:hypothetical protein
MIPLALACDEEGSGPVHSVHPQEVQISPIHDVETARLDKKNVEHADIVQFAVTDVNKRWNRAAQVQQRMQLDGRLGGSKRRPVEQAQA